ncbi:hypothetical protein G7062_10480 [Erysipelothrix sp. HDW6C]|uniref:hypothetical protein n=1 Tax=Erysipelothrix sp. HDW6C TaxID=2714930 RepID=UPI0014084D37|nr:hypothetical protein [Erysipelothrix sp. HDW6C]QIK70702.1 hypothetical protein G7062_10480 [Erysipelothrix sp. HDW6C]
MSSAFEVYKKQLDHVRGLVASDGLNKQTITAQFLRKYSIDLNIADSLLADALDVPTSYIIELRMKWEI